MEKLNVMIIGQNQSFNNLLKSILEKDSLIDRVITTVSLQDGINLLVSHTPDVLLLDANITGEEEKLPIATILKAKNVPVVVVAEGNVQLIAKTVQAMAHGAVDFIKIDINQVDNPDFHNGLIMKVIQASKGRPIRSVVEKQKEKQLHSDRNNSKEINRKNKTSSNVKDSIIVIGASTGGPGALQRLLQKVPEDFAVPILIVQHMPEKFTKSLAERLNSISHLSVKEAEHGEVIKKKHAYLAPGNHHMQVKKRSANYVIEINQEKEHLGDRPSVNLLYNSIAQLESIRIIAVILTGMGKDGASGIKKIKERQPEAIILTESKETAVIHGMPSAAIETNLVTEILHLDDITEALIDYTEDRGI